MDYMIFDKRGNALYSSEDETEAHAALRAIVKEEPEAADDFAILGYDDEGEPLGPALMYADLPPAAVVMQSEWLAVAHGTVATVGVVTQPHVVPQQPWRIRLDRLRFVA